VQLEALRIAAESVGQNDVCTGIDEPLVQVCDRVGPVGGPESGVPLR